MDFASFPSFSRALVKQIEDGFATALRKPEKPEQESQENSPSQQEKEMQEPQQGEQELEWIACGMRSVLSCGFCYQLLNEPVALVCGHSHCRGCIKFSLAVSPDKRMKCATPGCTSTHLGEREVKKLKVSITTREVLEKMFPIQVAHAAAGVAETMEKAEDNKKDGKRMPSPFIVFCNEHRQRIREVHPGATYTEMAITLDGAWRALTQEQKDQYKRRV